VISENLYFTR